MSLPHRDPGKMRGITAGQSGLRWMAAAYLCILTGDTLHPTSLHLTGLMYEIQAWSEYEYIRGEKERETDSLLHIHSNNNLGHISVIWQMLCLNVIFV